MRILVLGATGMLGQALVEYCKQETIFVEGVARSNTTYNFNLAENYALLENIICEQQFDIVINTVAIVDLTYCELYPHEAYQINSFFAGEVAKICDKLNVYYVQISTDHYYNFSSNTLSNEAEKVQLLNEYAKTKYLGEKLVETYNNTLIVRTNIVGFRGSSKNTFVEWAIFEIENRRTINGFTNMFTSSIDVKSFTQLLFALISDKKSGMYNLASKNAISKYEFLYYLAAKFKQENLVTPSVLIDTNVQRAKTLGLNIGKFQKEYPHLQIPSGLEVVDNIYNEYREGKDTL